jgi:hypothetical protein
MAQVDSENSTAMPTRPAGALTTVGLARQNREREKALRRLAKLRRKASDEIERLLAFLDASDPYAATELEDSIDDEPHDGDELEMSWVGVGATACELPWADECEADYGGRDANDEPSVGSLAADEAGDQTLWAAGGAVDIEAEHDGQEPAFCGLTADRACHGSATRVQS